MIKDDLGCIWQGKINGEDVTIRACDVDCNGNVENVDISINNVLRYCFNSQAPIHAGMTELLLKALWNK